MLQCNQNIVKRQIREVLFLWVYFVTLPPHQWYHDFTTQESANIYNFTLKCMTLYAHLLPVIILCVKHDRENTRIKEFQRKIALPQVHCLNFLARMVVW